MEGAKGTLIRLGLTLLSGALWFLACADFDIWPLAWIAMVPGLWVILDRRTAHPLRWGWVVGIVANGGGFYWINHLLMRFGHMPLVAAAPLYLLLVAYQGITFALFAWVLRRLRDTLELPVALLAPLCFTAVEFVVPYLFPFYVSITQAWVRPVIQIAELTGPLGVTFLLLLANGAVYEALSAWGERRRLPWRRLVTVGGAIALVVAYGYLRIHQVEARRQAAPKVKVGVVQANIGITEKFVPGLRERHLEEHQRLSAEAERRGAELIVWPESSYPYAFGRSMQEDFTDRRRVRVGFEKPLLFGALTLGDDSPYPFNTALMMDEKGRITATFDKNFLLVFGEYIPFYERIPWFRQVVPEASHFARGETVTTFPFGRYRLGPMICYEDILPDFGRRLARLRPNLLVNITNDAWFGATSEPWEHLALAVYRSVEHRLDLVRAVNTGVSAFIDATGRVYAHGPAVDPEAQREVKPVVLVEEAAMLEASGLFGTVGETFGAANLVGLLILGTLARRRQGRAVAFRTVGFTAALLGALLCLGAFAVAPGGRFGLALGLLAHRPVARADLDTAFALGGWLLLVAAVAVVAAAWVVTRTVGGRPRLETAAGAIVTLLAPAFLFGRLEGETAGLVFSALGALLLCRLGVRLGQRRGGASGTPASPVPAANPPPPSPPRRRRRGA